MTGILTEMNCGTYCVTLMKIYFGANTKIGTYYLYEVAKVRARNDCSGYAVSVSVS